MVTRSPLSYSEDASKVTLIEDPMEAPKEVLEGTNPVLSSEMFSVGITDGGLVVARGVMKCTPGKYRDVVDDDEFFSIIHGRATVEIMANSVHQECVLELIEGSVGELRKGSEVIYNVHETILKTFQLSMSASDEDDSDINTDIKAEQEFATTNYSVLSSTITLQPESMEEGVSWTNGNSPPVITSALLSSMDKGRLIRGVWRCTAGSCTYVEQDELFTVLAGQATVTIKRTAVSGTDSGAGGAVVEVPEGEEVRTLVLSKGMIGEFKAGDVATFEVEGEEAFLKSFQITGMGEPATTSASATATANTPSSVSEMKK